MSVAFSAKLSMLRKEKGITQMQAAQELQISQALLSHYEKGIRECSLDFVAKAAVYYGVTADFLLGLSESRHGLSDVYETERIESDDQAVPKSVIRTAIFLSEKAEGAGEESVSRYCDFFSLCVKKYTAALSGDPRTMTLCDLAMQTAAEEIRTSRGKKQDLSVVPRAMYTVLGLADQKIDETISSIKK